MSLIFYLKAMKTENMSDGESGDFITLIVSDIGNSVYLLEILITHSIHCLQFNRLANFLNNQIRKF